MKKIGIYILKKVCILHSVCCAGEKGLKYQPYLFSKAM